MCAGYRPWAETEELLGMLEALAAGEAKVAPGSATRKFYDSPPADTGEDVHNDHVWALQEAALLLGLPVESADEARQQEIFERMVPLLLRVLKNEIYWNFIPVIRPIDEVFAWLGERMLSSGGTADRRALEAVRLALKFADVQRSLWADGLQDICDRSQWRVIARGLAVRKTGHRERDYGRGPLAWLPNLVVMERDGKWLLFTDLWLSEEHRYLSGQYELDDHGWVTAVANVAAADTPAAEDTADTRSAGLDPRIEPYAREGVTLAGAVEHRAYELALRRAKQLSLRYSQTPSYRLCFLEDALRIDDAETIARINAASERKLRDIAREYVDRHAPDRQH